jgi:acetate kinase
MKILVLNSGSSSLKFQLFDIQLSDIKLFDIKACRVLASGLVEQIGESQSVARMEYDIGSPQREYLCRDRPVVDHQQAIEIMVDMLKQSGCMTGLAELAGIGHRVVHGGENFHEPVIIDEQVLTIIEDLIPLAPLHNPANLIGIKVAKQAAPHIPQVAVFDTAFHQTLPEQAYIYGLPYTLYEQHQVRRYGFHGSSHHYVAKRAAAYLGVNSSQLKLISFHLGNGTSAAAILNGKSIDTSMGMTPLEGLLMGTRCGDIDPAIPFYLARETGMSIQQLDDLLNKHSGLKGICSENDMRVIIEQAEKGGARSGLAINIFCYRIKKYIGAYMAALNGADAIIFTGGIGENSSLIRERCCENLQYLGIEIDPQKNCLQKKKRRSNEIMQIQRKSSRVKVLVIPTNEELEIALQTIKLL